MIEPSVFAAHWLGHRHLTRRVIAAFPPDALFTFSPAPPLRPFGEMVWELHGQTAYTLRGLLDGDWGEPTWDTLPGTDRAAVLAAWDGQTARIETGLPGVPAERYGETLTLSWGEMLVFTAVIGSIDNEVHHRGQGMVYLRELGTQPPDFWDRS
ncbi:DinB family protein [Deinococcus koreensis]|uniref:Damage-inducible protein DinB n=1 Tax=Deinococcus koreensis TaxID=2054903 RepID=A0A2K3UXE2_9DEIO|nr:DinB family protein [Deinococcus koreensis]PNY81201.1 damage-inducible protein DinB [Deinococcus koreensis]